MHATTGTSGVVLRCRCWPTFPDSELERKGGPADTKGGDKLDGHARMLGAGLSKWPPSRSHLICTSSSRTEGKPAVRNDRGDGGDVGIIRSPIRATILLD